MLSNQIHRERELKLTFEAEYKIAKSSASDLQKEVDRYRIEIKALTDKLKDAERRLEYQTNNFQTKQTTATTAVKEFENKLEELTEEKENWRDLLYQEKQNSQQIKERCKITR